MWLGYSFWETFLLDLCKRASIAEAIYLHT